eukprot:2594905-Amphidinium_carterae.1
MSNLSIARWRRGRPHFARAPPLPWRSFVDITSMFVCAQNLGVLTRGHVISGTADGQILFE